jgi:hypothetical protein
MITIRSTDGIHAEILNEDGTPIKDITHISIEMKPGNVIVAKLELVRVRLELAAHDIDEMSELSIEIQRLLDRCNGKKHD